MIDGTLTQPTMSAPPVFTPEQLRFLAFNRSSSLVFTQYHSLSADVRSTCHDCYVLGQAVKGAIDRLRQVAEGDDAGRGRLAAAVTELLAEFAGYCEATGSCPEEIFQAWHCWATYLAESGNNGDAVEAAEIALAIEAGRFPEIRLCLWTLQAECLPQIGETDRVRSLLA